MLILAFEVPVWTVRERIVHGLLSIRVRDAEEKAGLELLVWKPSAAHGNRDGPESEQRCPESDS